MITCWFWSACGRLAFVCCFIAIGEATAVALTIKRDWLALSLAIVKVLVLVPILKRRSRQQNELLCLVIPCWECSCEHSNEESGLSTGLSSSCLAFYPGSRRNLVTKLGVSVVIGFKSWLYICYSFEPPPAGENGSGLNLVRCFLPIIFLFFSFLSLSLSWECAGERACAVRVHVCAIVIVDVDTK